MYSRFFQLHIPLLAVAGISVSIMAGAPAHAQNKPFSSGWFVGAEGSLTTPYFERDILGADENVGALGTLEVLSFDWDADGAYRGWIGYERASGFGVSLSHAILNQSTSFSRAEGTGNLQVHFDPDTDDADIFVDGTLVAKNTLEMMSPTWSSGSGPISAP